MEEAVSLARADGRQVEALPAAFMTWLGCACERGEYARSTSSCIEECLVAFRELGNKVGIAASLHQLALVLFLTLDDQ